MKFKFFKYFFGISAFLGIVLVILSDLILTGSDQILLFMIGFYMSLLAIIMLIFISINEQIAEIGKINGGSHMNRKEIVYGLIFIIFSNVMSGLLGINLYINGWIK